MESWSVGYDGDDDVQRHAGVETGAAPSAQSLRLRIVSDYI